MDDPESKPLAVRDRTPRGLPEVLHVIQTIRNKDIYLAESVYYLNEEVDRLKGAAENGKKRSLLGARRSVHESLQFHPKRDDPDAYLVCPQGNHSWAEPGSQLSQSMIRHTLRKLAEDAGIDKPPNPHNYRHYFVTHCKSKYDMEDSTINHLIGHGPVRSLVDTTYQHLSDDDYIKKAEEAVGLREWEEV